MLLVSEITVPISSVLPPPSKTGCRFQALKLHCLCLVSLFQRPQPNYLHLVVVVADAQGPGDALLSPSSSFFSPRREPSEDRRSLLAAAECPSCAAGEVRPALRGHRCRSASQCPSPLPPLPPRPVVATAAGACRLPAGAPPFIVARHHLRGPGSGPGEK